MSKKDPHPLAVRWDTEHEDKDVTRLLEAYARIRSIWRVSGVAERPNWTPGGTLTRRFSVASISMVKRFIQTTPALPSSVGR
jgi:hypothetical protein